MDCMGNAMTAQSMVIDIVSPAHARSESRVSCIPQHRKGMQHIIMLPPLHRATHCAEALFTKHPRRSASAIRAAQTGLRLRVLADPRIHRARLARVIATLMRRTSCRNPRVPPGPGWGDSSGAEEWPDCVARTQDRMITSSCLPWKLSTVATIICRAARIWH